MGGVEGEREGRRDRERQREGGRQTEMQRFLNQDNHSALVGLLTAAH